MRLRSSETDGWLSFDDVKEDGRVVTAGSRLLARNQLIDMLSATNLIVLTGLGTSLCVNAQAELLGLPGAPTMFDLWNAAKQRDNDNFPKLLKSVGYSPPKGSENLEVLLSRCKVALEYLSDTDDGRQAIVTFTMAAEEIIRKSCGFVSEKTPLAQHEAFLRRIGRRSARKSRTRLFTTNYDRCFEEAARRCRFVLIDGFSPHLPQTYDAINFSYDIVRRERTTDAPDFIENVIHLYKLHGSVDWQAQDGDIHKVLGTDRPLLIYPRSSKYEQAFEPPYLDMMASFQTALRQPDTALLVIGFGFRDDHLARPILSALNSNLSLRVFVCDPRFYPHDSETDEQRLRDIKLHNPYHASLDNLIFHGDPRVVLMAGTFEEFVREVPDLAAESDRERHAERFRKLKEFEAR